MNESFSLNNSAEPSGLTLKPDNTDLTLNHPLPSSTASLTSLNLTVDEIELRVTKFLEDGGGECLFHLGPDEKSEDNAEQNARLMSEWEKYQENLFAVGPTHIFYNIFSSNIFRFNVSIL